MRKHACPRPCPVHNTRDNPPTGWFPFGHHAAVARAARRGESDPVPRLILSWTHMGDDFLPLWERPIRERPVFGEQEVLFA